MMMPKTMGRFGLVGLALLSAAGLATTARGDDDPPRATLSFFWGVGCPHCEAAKPFVDRLARENERLDVERIEVRRDAAGRARFLRTMERLDVAAAGVPTFVVGDEAVVGYVEGRTDALVRAMVDRALGLEAATGSRDAREDQVVELPAFGALDARTVALPVFAVVVGLVDGINPCAIWVLVVLLGILTHVRSTRRIVIVAGTFVVMSGVVYFLFMTGWLGLFRFVGLSREITIALGVVVLAMGLVNLKELVWFRQGPSLTIPDQAKPTLYRRMRAVANATSLPAAVLGVVGLAFFVNLIELACTIGLPAVFTRILSLRDDLSTMERYGYLVVYNVAYVVPLFLVVVVYATTLHRTKLSERGAKVLKAISGVLLVDFGAL